MSRDAMWCWCWFWGCCRRCLSSVCKLARVSLTIVLHMHILRYVVYWLVSAERAMFGITPKWKGDEHRTQRQKRQNCNGKNIGIVELINIIRVQWFFTLFLSLQKERDGNGSRWTQRSRMVSAICVVYFVVHYDRCVNVLCVTHTFFYMQIKFVSPSLSLSRFFCSYGLDSGFRMRCSSLAILSLDCFRTILCGIHSLSLYPRARPSAHQPPLHPRFPAILNFSISSDSLFLCTFSALQPCPFVVCNWGLLFNSGRIFILVFIFSHWSFSRFCLACFSLFVILLGLVSTGFAFNFLHYMNTAKHVSFRVLVFALFRLAVCFVLSFFRSIFLFLWLRLFARWLLHYISRYFVPSFDIWLYRLIS